MNWKFLLLTSLTLPIHASKADVVSYFANGESGRRIEFGNARDGNFTDGPAQPGISIVGATITFHTDQKSTFEFENFTLTSGKTLIATGPLPLVIRVRGTTTLTGTLNLNGAAGENANAAHAGIAGTASAGGGDGGRGGALAPAGSHGTSGMPLTGHSRGGQTPPNETPVTTQQAGGGGCNGTGATAGYRFPSGAGGCLLAQSEIASRFEESFDSSFSGRAGGGGGGGGGTRDNAGNAMNGAGGGGGGGALRLSSLGPILFSGSITANGGAGGDANLGNLDYGSSGGGGSGGSVWLQTASALSGSGSVAVLPGMGGQDVATTNIGGNGSRGVVRFDVRENQYSGAITPVNAPDQLYGVSPVTVEFDLSAGPACGTLTRPLSPEESRLEIVSLCFWLVCFAAYYKIIRSRSANSSYSSQA